MRYFSMLCLLGSLVPTAALASSGDNIPGHPDVIGEYVQIPGAQAAGTPGALNTATYLRVRLLADGNSPKPAHAVVIGQPGFASTPGVWIEMAAQLVEKAAARDCGEEEPSPCRIEFWIMDRRGSQIEDTAGLRTARSADDAISALDYYFGVEVLGLPFPGDGRFPLAPPDDLIALGFGDFVPLTTQDVPFMSEWGFETMAADVDALIDLLPTAKNNGSKNVFLAGHSQGGGFVSLYAGRRLADGRRGHENLAGLIFLDGGPSIGSQPAPTADEINTHLQFVGGLRAGLIPVFGAAAIGSVSLSPGIGALSGVVGAFQDLTPDAESIFVPQSIANFEFFSPEFFYLLTLQHTYRANGGMTFDEDPVPCSPTPLQFPFLQALGANLGELDETNSPTPCLMPDGMLHDWIDGGGTQPPTGEPSKASAFMNSNGYGPSFTNVRPVTVTFPATGRVETIDAGEMNGFTWYQSVRYDGDSGFLGQYQVIDFDVAGVSHDIDRTTIAAPVYVARRGTSTTNPFPLVDDFTIINSLGTSQSDTAAALSPIDPAINSSQYGHTDFMMADDSQAGARRPGQAGASLTSNTLIDWLLERSRGRAPTPKPSKLGVVQTR